MSNLQKIVRPFARKFTPFTVRVGPKGGVLESYCDICIVSDRRTVKYISGPGVYTIRESVEYVKREIVSDRFVDVPSVRIFPLKYSRIVRGNGVSNVQILFKPSGFEPAFYSHIPGSIDLLTDSPKIFWPENLYSGDLLVLDFKT
jgi:hypothetical protein